VACEAIWRDTPAQAAAAADVLITMLPGPREVQAAMLGEAGALKGLPTGATWIDMTSNSPAAAGPIQEQAMKQGVEVLEAPVGGGIADAHEGKLQLFVGGAASVVERHRALLEVLSAGRRLPRAVGAIRPCPPDLPPCARPLRPGGWGASGRGAARRRSRRQAASSEQLRTRSGPGPHPAAHLRRRCHQVAAGTSGEATGPADCILVYLVRHGQTPLNESGVLRGLLDPPLDEAGHLQAGRLGAVLAPKCLRSSSPARCCGRGRPHSRSPTVPAVT
jgi:hypothetical protein